MHPFGRAPAKVVLTPPLIFADGAGSEAQGRALAAIAEAHYWRLMKSYMSLPNEAKTPLAGARSLILEAEASCYVGLGESRIARLYERIAPAKVLLREAEAAMASA